jgi:4-amino-4-deoxy-L-arabinose transferase
MRAPSTFPLETVPAVRRPPATRAAWPDARSLRRPLLFIALVLYAFSFQGTRGIWEPDEGRYTAVALEMGRLGDYVCPHLNHEVEHLTKPPLTYWLLAGSIAVFGTSEWAARLPNALAFLATVLLVVRLGRRLAPASPGLAPWIYSTSLLPFVAANVVTTDTLLTLWETLAVWGFVELWWGVEERRGPYRLVTWLGFGLAFLTKGPPGLLPLLAIVAFAVLAEGRRGMGKLLSPAALAVFAFVGLGWYVLLWLREPGVLDDLVRHEVFARIFTAEHDRNAAWYGPIVIYGPALLLGTLPWTGSVLAACRDAWRSVRRAVRERDPLGSFLPDIFLLLWLLLPLTVFALARSRLHLYLLPLFVPLSLLAARRRGPSLALTPRRRLGLAVWILLLVSLRGLAGAVPQTKDSRALARAIQGSVRPAIDEVVFIGTPPRYGLSFYLDAEVEAVTLGPRSAPPRAQRLDEELREEEGVRLFVLPRHKIATFRDHSRKLGFTSVPRGGWRDLDFYELQRLEKMR